jgi:hypothetical protein
MRMVLDIIVLVQKYITVVLLLVSAFIWMVIRQRESEDVFKMFNLRRIYTIGILLLLPFLVGVLTFINEDILGLAISFLLLLIFLSMFAVLIKVFRKKSEERMKDLKDLLKTAKKHPIRYEFARKIVAPEYKKLREKEQEFKKNEKESVAKIKKQEAILKVKEAKTERKIEKLNSVKAYVESNFNKADEFLRSTERKDLEASRVEKQILNKQKLLEKKEKDIATTLGDYKKSIEENKKRKLELDNKLKNFNQELAMRKNEEMKKLRLDSMVKLRERERELDLLDAETRALKKDIERRERNLGPRFKRLERREAFVESRFSKMRMKESEIREALDNVQIIKKNVAKEEKNLKNAKEDFEDFKDDVTTKEKKTERVRVAYERRNELLKERDAKLDNLEAELDSKRRKLDALEKRLARKNKEISIMQVKLDKQMETSEFEKEKKKTDDDIGELISEKVFTKNVRLKKGPKKKLVVRRVRRR